MEVVIVIPAGRMLAHAMLLVYAFDLPAHALVLQMKQFNFNGKCGCLYCEYEGEVDPANHLLRYWPYSRDSP